MQLFLFTCCATGTRQLYGLVRYKITFKTNIPMDQIVKMRPILSFIFYNGLKLVFIFHIWPG